MDRTTFQNMNDRLGTYFQAAVDQELAAWPTPRPQVTCTRGAWEGGYRIGYGLLNYSHLPLERLEGVLMIQHKEHGDGEQVSDVIGAMVFPAEVAADLDMIAAIAVAAIRIHLQRRTALLAVAG
ncbi:hypothetical protein ACFFMN_23895 [Planobispora siamensis]|uniref:Uncharacterized protein n=1 Tax=Planobispora siamensis TaxID=936338 RepID=A0A8J3SMX1_9ACTN|nr:hypothetical protein [Planobispora siamensis]GIH95380.1 hypothetical protein Psi01_60100 [Planobispora siamensis]